MSFQIRPTREILVVPAMPPALRRLPELGLNLLWSWNHSMRAVFRRLDPAAWKASNHNPVVMLGRVEQVALSAPPPIPAISRSTSVPAKSSTLISKPPPAIPC